MLFVGAASFFVGPQDRLNRAVVDAQLQRDFSLAKVVNLAIVDNIKSITVTNVLVHSVGLHVLELLRILLHLFWDKKLSRL